MCFGIINWFFGVTPPRLYEETEYTRQKNKPILPTKKEVDLAMKQAQEENEYFKIYHQFDSKR